MPKSDANLNKILKKACSIDETAPKRKHVRSCIVYTWDHKSAKEVFRSLQTQPFTTTDVQLFKMLIVMHKIIQEGHPSALKEAIRDREWIRSLERVPTSGPAFEDNGYRRLIKEYVKYLLMKLDFHASHKGFHNGTFEYEEYVSLVSVSDPDEGYETILDLMQLQDFIDEYSNFALASIQSDRVNNDCKIASLIPMVAESYGIYKFVTSMLRAMYRQLGKDDPALQPLRERYELQHARLFELYADCSSIKLLTSLLTLPRLPTQPPNVTDFDKSDAAQDKEIKFHKADRSEPPRRETPSPAPVQPPAPRSRSSSVLATPSNTGMVTGLPVMIPTVTGAAAMVPGITGIPVQPDYYAQQQMQYANEQARLEEQRQQQLREQQAQQQQFQAQVQRAQQEMMNLQLQQQAQQQTDLIALNNQYERDQTMLQQYDQRVQQLEQEVTTMNENAKQQIENKDEQLHSLEEQMDVWQKKYDSLAKLYSQLRQEHLQLLPKFKKLQIKVNSAHEAIRQKEHLETKIKHKDIQMADLIKDRDRLRLENDRLQANGGGAAGSREQTPSAALTENKLNTIMDGCLESGIATIQESVFDLESPANWSAPTSSPALVMTLIESAGEYATEFATSFNDLIVDGIVDGDQASVISNISEFSIAMASLISNCKAYCTTTLSEDINDTTLVKVVKSCAREAQYFFEDLMSDNLASLKDDEERTDLVINANVDMQGKLQELLVALEPLMQKMDRQSSETQNDPHAQLVATEKKIVKSSAKLRVKVNIDGVPQPLVSLSLSIIDAIVALVRAAIECQNEISETTNVSLTQFYKKNSRWTEGLISAARAVGSATNILISTASNLTAHDKTGSPEEIIVASKEVASSTIQLVAASRVKTLPHSKAQSGLEECSKAVTTACRMLVAHVMEGANDAAPSDEKPIEFDSDRAVKTAEMEQQVTILKLEQSLNNARKRLGEIRKHAYYLYDNDDDDESEENGV